MEKLGILKDLVNNTMGTSIFAKDLTRRRKVVVSGNIVISSGFVFLDVLYLVQRKYIKQELCGANRRFDAALREI
jgi:hypothetical protein